MSVVNHQTPPFNYFSGAFSNLRKIIDDSHKLGFDNSYLYSCLYVYAGGGHINNQHTNLSLSRLGLLKEDKDLTPLGNQLLGFLDGSTTGKPYIWAQEACIHPVRIEIQLTLA